MLRLVVPAPPRFPSRWAQGVQTMQALVVEKAIA